MEAVWHSVTCPPSDYEHLGHGKWDSFYHQTASKLRNLVGGQRKTRYEFKNKLVTELEALFGKVGNELPLLTMEAIRDAQTFVYALPENASEPEVSISGLGSIGLYWDTKDVFIDILFTGAGHISFYINTQRDEYLGDNALISFTRIPKVIEDSIPRHF